MKAAKDKPDPRSDPRWGYVALGVIDHRAAVVRANLAERNRRLSETDWTQLPDVPADTQLAYRAYRQSLRDITKQHGWPANVEWPQPPQQDAGNE